MSAFLAPVSAAPRMQICGLIIPNYIMCTILSASPDFGTLNSATGICKAWHGVFETHPKTIILSVARNVVGPALKHAVRFIRYPYPEKNENEWGADEDGGDEDGENSEDTVDSENEDEGPKKQAKKSGAKSAATPESDDIGELSSEERGKLQNNAEIVHKLESIFSLRHKDRTSTTSQLTVRESHRFARAMYRIMLYCELFYLPINLDDIDSMEDDPALLKIWDQRHALLSDFPMPELLEMRAVVAFLHDLIGEGLDADDYDHICLATGPAVILKAYSSKRFELFEDAVETEVMTSGEDNPFFGEFLSRPLDRIWTERGVALPTSDGLDSAILEGVRGKNDKCAQCGVVAGLGLWSEANWANLINVDFCALLPGALNENDVESDALVELFMSTCPADVVIAEIYDMKTAPFAGWKRDQSLCAACLDKLIGAHLHLWLYERKVQSGWTPTDNCWYGYNCRTQVHKREHAKARNHLCAPTRRP
ncbi:hypothetical protein DFH07DRAFT_852854 [Mycena maculata]|uniref:Aprataxin and PNK-like factor PBZ domain-containing protein n=1 Tax=Mycena maculata TaxID=230809 RepID=A0AAD7MP08_9AGAR|nr:hypothetical protein DFH07DRAFT_852854 [Mycena maculata]